MHYFQKRIRPYAPLEKYLRASYSQEELLTEPEGHIRAAELLRHQPHSCSHIQVGVHIWPDWLLRFVVCFSRVVAPVDSKPLRKAQGQVQGV